MSSTSIPQLDFQHRPTIPGKFGPRTGNISIKRFDNLSNQKSNIDIPTPGLICSTTRGIVQHLSNDNVLRTTAIKWVHVPFESFLQIDPPIPTLQKGVHPLHDFLGLSPSHYILSMSLRDPANGREMPANGNSFVTAETSRGARKVTASAYRSYATTVLPDIIFPLTDIPFTSPPHSQKRLTKSIERSGQYLLDALRPVGTTGISRLNVFVPMIGGISEAARSAFAASLLEVLEPHEKERVLLDYLDAGVSGYVFDLLPMRQSLHAELSNTPAPTMIYRPVFTNSFPSLLRASLQRLPSNKPRIVHTALSPHEILILIRDIGIDLFDSFWAQQAANWGVALDFKFPVSSPSNGKRQVGHNLYDAKFANDFSRLSDQFSDALDSKQQKERGEAKKSYVCMCSACTPIWVGGPLRHSLAQVSNVELVPEIAPPYTRAYIHHLLHTHEMTAHALLVMHNITILDAFLRDIRNFLENELDPVAFSREVTLFGEVYDSELEILDAAKACWSVIDLARGKGRLARERVATSQIDSASI